MGARCSASAVHGSTEREPEAASRPSRLAASPPTLRLCRDEQWVDGDAGYDIAHVINP
jgi:hypothetical protein